MKIKSASAAATMGCYESPLLKITCAIDVPWRVLCKGLPLQVRGNGATWASQPSSIGLEDQLTVQVIFNKTSTAVEAH